MNIIRTKWDKTAGYKTVTGGALALLYQLFELVFPDLLTPGWEQWVQGAISFLLTTGLLDKIWRNRREIIEFIRRLVKTHEKRGES